MNLSIAGNQFLIELEWFEQLLAFTFDKTFHIPLDRIERVTSDEPQSDWAEIRAPGTFLPGVIKAGTYYSKRGKEFWYVTRDKDYLTLELKDNPYKRIVLTVDSNEAWVERINESKLTPSDL
ncbi:hypothetical protein [Kamptonema formosum]|uniref:hypothetical protein n=1 Tax=Kamptonema formosum TaxID=331992 RepID=UPI000346EAC7|nr:hypothetical protein [Oscillatoria sp. PCC 10802]